MSPTVSNVVSTACLSIVSIGVCDPLTTALDVTGGSGSPLGRSLATDALFVTEPAFISFWVTV